VARATTSKLAPGEHTAARATARPQKDGSLRVQFSYRLRDGSATKQSSVTGRTVGETRRRAKQKAEALIRSGGGDWRLDSRLEGYVDDVVRPLLEEAKVKPLSMETYEKALRMLLGDCPSCKDLGRSHGQGLRRHTIGSIDDANAVKRMFVELINLHGFHSARSCRTVWNKYVATPLVRSGLMVNHAAITLELKELFDRKMPVRQRGGVALSQKDYDRIIDWLITVDPVSLLNVHSKSNKVWKPELQILTKRNALDITLLQMATGLRQSEARQTHWSMVTVDPAGVMTILLPAHVSKDKKERPLAVLNERVCQHLLERRERLGDQGYVVGSPMDPTKVWYRTSCVARTREVYQRIAQDLGVEEFEVERSHVWRTTLRSLYSGKVPEHTLNIQFGHSTDVATKHYTDRFDLDSLIGAAGLGSS
jgi:integrase